MKDLITKISEHFASKYAGKTNDNEMVNIYYEAKKEDDLRDARIAELEATIKSMQQELQLLKNDNKSLKEVTDKQKKSEAAKKAAKTRKERREAADVATRHFDNPGYGGCGVSTGRGSWGGC